MTGVEFFDVDVAVDEAFREGPFTPGFVVDNRLRKAVLAYRTC
jgi:hypothetical protein